MFLGKAKELQEPIKAKIPALCKPLTELIWIQRKKKLKSFTKIWNKCSVCLFAYGNNVWYLIVDMEFIEFNVDYTIDKYLLWFFNVQ